MNWQEYIANRTCAAAEAAARIKSGDRVVIGHAAGSPAALVNAMVQRAGELTDVEVVHMVALDDCPYNRPEHEGSFRFNGLYLSAGTRAAVAEGRADYTPVFFSHIPELLRSETFPVDVALITVSPPDATGKVSLGVAVDYTMQAALSARVTIAVVNANMPYIAGGALLDATAIDCFVFSDDPIPQLAPPVIGHMEKAIGHNIAGLIKDGDCLQLGIGAIPDAVLGFLSEKKDLGIHSEMISDGVMRLAQLGVVTGARKNIHNDKILITFAMGSKDFYRWLNNNPMVESYPVDYINDPRVIGRHNNLVSINSALSVDLLGQVAADSIGPRQFSGVGGQVDFVRGARFSEGGRSVIAMPATASKGAVSRVCGGFIPGQPVTTSRNDVDYVVTEYGVAALRGRTNAQRAAALISVAAPEFREGLEREARNIYGLKLSVV